MDWHTTSAILEDLHDYENRSAWDMFVSRFRRPMVCFVRDMGLGEADAEDVTQEALLAFAKAYRAGKYDRSKGRLSKWLFGIVFRQVLSARRERARHGGPAARDEKSASFWANLPDEGDATASWDQTWQRTVLQQCLDQVRHEVEETTFRAFELTALAKRPPAEVAKQLGITRNAVFIAKHRVLQRLGKRQQEYEQPL